MDAGAVAHRMRECKGKCGLDTSTGQYADPIEAGIIGATKVVRVALENAVSVAGTLPLTEATSMEERESKPALQREPELPVE
jgi:chaperonin GroEL